MFPHWGYYLSFPSKHADIVIDSLEFIYGHLNISKKHKFPCDVSMWDSASTEGRNISRLDERIEAMGISLKRPGKAHKTTTLHSMKPF